MLSPNIAKNGVATQINNYHHTQFSDPDYAFYAINEEFSTDILNGNARCALTNRAYGAWWQVDLLTKYRIVKVAITTRKSFGI